MTTTRTLQEETTTSSEISTPVQKTSLPSAAEQTTAPLTTLPEPITEEPCKPVWFERQPERDLHYDVIKANCAQRAIENNATSGFPAFFRTPEEWREFNILNLPLRIEYLGMIMKYKLDKFICI